MRVATIRRTVVIAAVAAIVAVVLAVSASQAPESRDEGDTLAQVAEPVAEHELPAPVVAAMRSHPRAIYGSGQKVTRNGSVHYELTLRGTRKTTMVVTPDGTVLSFK